MKKTTKWLSRIICLVLIGILTVGLTACGNKITWSHDDGIFRYQQYTAADGSVYYHLVGLIDPKSTTTLMIPHRFNGAPITAINKNAFKGNTALTAVTIPMGLQTIGEGAFYQCTNLTTVTIAETVTSVGNNAFAECPIQTAKIPYTVLQANANHTAFALSDLTDLTLTGRGAVTGCSLAAATQLTSLTIGQNITGFGADTFKDCTALQNVYIDSLEHWLELTFANATANPLSVINTPTPAEPEEPEDPETPETPEDPETDDDTDDEITDEDTATDDVIAELNTLAEDDTTAGEDPEEPEDPDAPTEDPTEPEEPTVPTIPEIISFATLYIADEDGNYQPLTELVLPDTTTKLNDYAFYRYQALTAVTLPATLSYLGADAFRDAYHLLAVNFAVTNGWTCNDLLIDAALLQDPLTAALLLTQSNFLGLDNAYAGYAWEL